MNTEISREKNRRSVVWWWWLLERMQYFHLLLWSFLFESRLQVFTGELMMTCIFVVFHFDRHVKSFMMMASAKMNVHLLWFTIRIRISPKGILMASMHTEQLVWKHVRIICYEMREQGPVSDNVLVIKRYTIKLLKYIQRLYIKVYRH